MPKWPDDVAKEVQWDIHFALNFKIGRKLRPLFEAERQQIAFNIVQHLQLANWDIRRGGPSRDGRALADA
jgi:hypothetical protein